MLSGEPAEDAKLELAAWAAAHD